MKNIELVSVITPAFNSEKFIAETITSVLSQTYPNWEMIIVDDCSTDNSYQIATEYAKKDSRIIVLQNEKKYILNILIDIYNHNNNCLIGYNNEIQAKYKALRSR